MNRKQFIIILGLWLLIICGLIGYKQMILWNGTTVYLRTQPIDPRDLFRGDYVILSYEVSHYDRIPFKPGETEQYTRPGSPIYVVLSVGDQIGYPLYKTFEKPEDELFLKGRYIGYGRNSIEYGIESYFVPEGTGYEIERARGNDLLVEVVIDKGGNAVIRDIRMH